MNCFCAGVNGKAMFGVRQVGALDDVINDDDDDGGVDDDDDDDDTDRQTGRQKKLTLYFNTTFLQVQDAGFR